MSGGALTFAVGIPVYNEEEILVENSMRLLAELERLGQPFELLIGSNGSTDATIARCRELSARDPRVRWFDLPERAPGRAFRNFLDQTRAAKLISLDMDLSVDLGFVPAALALLDDHDAVVGSKRAGVQRRSIVRRAGSATFVLAARALLGVGVEDYSMAAKGYRVEVVRRVAPRTVDGSAYVLEVLVAIHRAGGRIVEIPVDCDDRRASRFHLGAEALHKFGHLARLALRR